VVMGLPFFAELTTPDLPHPAFMGPLSLLALAPQVSVDLGPQRGDKAVCQPTSGALPPIGQPGGEVHDTGPGVLCQCSIH